MSHTHTYQSQLSWEGSTADGYDSYDRKHRVSLPPAREKLILSDDRHPDLANPEQLLLVAASSCQLLWFLHLASRKGLDVHAYEDEAEAIMPEDQTPMRITQVTLRPRITVAQGTDIEEVVQLVERAHQRCYIANTLNAAVVIEPNIAQAGAASASAG